jgi:hypothetical protein
MKEHWLEVLEWIQLALTLSFLVVMAGVIGIVLRYSLTNLFSFLYLKSIHILCRNELFFSHFLLVSRYVSHHCKFAMFYLNNRNILFKPISYLPHVLVSPNLTLNVFILFCESRNSYYLIKQYFVTHYSLFISSFIKVPNL